MDQPARIPTRLMGFALICVGQWLITRLTPLVSIPLSTALNTYYHLGFFNFDNVLVGILVLLIGAVLFGDGISASTVTPAMIVGPIARLRRADLRWSTVLLVASAALLGGLLARLARLDESGWLVAAWIGVQALFVAALVLRDQRAQVPRAHRLPNTDLAFIVGLVIAGLVIGSYQLARLPRSLIGDEGRFWEVAQGITTGEYKTSLFDFGVYSYPVFSSFYQAAILKVFGYSLWSWRFSSVLAGVAAIVPTYLLAREFFDRRVAVLANIALIALPYMLAFERLGYNNSQALLPVVLALYLLYVGLNRGSATWVGLSGMTAGYGFDTYTAGRLGLVCGVFFLFYLFVSGLRHRRQITWTIALFSLIFVAGWATAALPHIVYGSAKDPNLLRYKTLESLFANLNYARTIFPEAELFRDYPPITIGPETLFYRPDLYAILLVRGVFRTLLVFHHNDLIRDHYIVGPLAGSFTAVFYVCGLVSTCATRRTPQSWLLLLWFISGIVFLSIMNTFPPRYQHMVPLIPLIAIFIAVGLCAIVDTLSELFVARQTIARWALTSAATLALLFSGLQTYFVQAQNAYPPNIEHTMAFMALEAQKPQDIVFIYTDPQQKNFVPWIIQHIPNKVSFHMVSRDDLLQRRFIFNQTQPSTIFFEPKDQANVDDYLAQLTNQHINPQPYFNRNGEVMLLSYTFTPPQAATSR